MENLNLAGPQFSTTGAGSRSNFGGVQVDDTYGGIFLVSNTGEGQSWNASLTLSKNFYSPLVDVRTQATYSYGDSDVLFEGTSSQNISNWAFNESVNGSNNLTVSTSDFAQGDRFLANVVADFKWSDNLKTTLGIFYDGIDGTPFSYVVGGFSGANLIDDSGEGVVPLPFIPSSFEEALLVDDGDLTAEQQWELLDAFISCDDFLSGRRGLFSERIGARAKMIHVIDF